MTYSSFRGYFYYDWSVMAHEHRLECTEPTHFSVSKSYCGTIIYIKRFPEIAKAISVSKRISSFWSYVIDYQALLPRSKVACHPSLKCPALLRLVNPISLIQPLISSKTLRYSLQSHQHSQSLADAQHYQLRGILHSLHALQQTPS